MRPIWSGVIGFGLVNIPVRLYSPAPEEGRFDFDYLHSIDHSPIRYARVCKKEEKEIPYEDIVRGIKIGKKYVVLTDEDFSSANMTKTQTIEVVHFASKDEIDHIFYEKPYYLEPENKGAKAYAVFREALIKSKKVGIAKFVLRSREHLATIEPYEDIIILNQLRYASEIASPGRIKLPKVESLPREEMKMATEIIQKFTRPFNPKKYKDAYSEDLMELISKKAKGITPKPKGKTPEPTNVNDLMAQLKASLSKGKSLKKSNKS